MMPSKPSTNDTTEAWDEMRWQQRSDRKNGGLSPAEIAAHVHAQMRFLVEHDVTSIICCDGGSYSWSDWCADTWGGEVPYDNAEPFLRALLLHPDFPRLNRQLRDKYGSPFYHQPKGDGSDKFGFYPWELNIDAGLKD